MISKQQVMLASGNAGKLKEFNQAFIDLGIELVPQPKTSEYEVEETGSTFVENAIIKARHASRLSGLPSLADDSGLIVPALDGAPGVYSARYAGLPSNAQNNLNLLLENMNGIKNREAYFFCCLVYMRHHQDPDPVIAKGIWRGLITHTASGSGGFGYDPIFHVPEHGCTAAELSADIKQAISHRGLAIAALKPQLDGL
jgi:XTP/dITP diphosphohydrolase